jgi:transcriptional regulator with XRE-family HTH domain
MMKQPELGKRILELRKSKGFTQEELVEKCNINVRTIQRIEAGEVAPRNFTIRTILEALGVDADAFFVPTVHEEDKVRFTAKDVRKLRLSWIGAIFFTIFSTLSVLIEYSFQYESVFSPGDFLVLSVLSGVSLTSLLFFMQGYKILGDRLNNKTLVYASYLYLVLEAVSIAIIIVLSIYQFEYDFVELTSGVLLTVLLGIGELVLGLGVLKLKSQFGAFAQTLGIVKVTFGVMLITVLFSFMALVVGVPLLIAEIIFLFHVTQKIKK